MRVKTVVVRIGFSHLDGQVIGVCVVFVYVDQTLHFGRRRTEQPVGCVAIVALVTGDIAVLIVDRRQTLTFQVRHVIHVGLHRFVARGAELNCFGSLEDEDGAERNGEHRHNSDPGDQQPQRDRTGNPPAVAHKTVDDQAGANNQESRENSRSVVLDWIVLERVDGPFRVAAQGNAQKAQKQVETRQLHAIPRPLHAIQ